MNVRHSTFSSTYIHDISFMEAKLETGHNKLYFFLHFRVILVIRNIHRAYADATICYKIMFSLSLINNRLSFVADLRS